MRYIDNFGVKYAKRVQKNIGKITPDYRGKLSGSAIHGYFRGIY